MRKLLIFSSVCAISLYAYSNITFAAVDPTSAIDGSPSVNTSGGGISVKDTGLHNGLKDLGTIIGNGFKLSTEEIIKFITGDLSKQTEALQTTSGVDMKQAAAVATAQDTNRAITTQQSQNAAAQIETQNIAEVACPGITSTMSYGSAETIARETAEVELAERMKVLNAEAGQVSENGLIDMNRQLYDMAMGFCKADGNGGAAVNCTGADNEHISIGTLLFRPNVGLGIPTSPDDLPQLTYLQNLLYGHVPISLNPNLLENPTTNVKNLWVESDRLKAEVGIGQAAFSQVLAERTPTPNPGRSIPYITELLKEGDFLSPAQVSALFPENRASVRAQLDAITLGMMNPNFLQQQLVNNPNAMGINIAYNTALTNRLLYKMLGELEFIKLAIATDISASRFDEIKELNARINAVNSKQ